MAREVVIVADADACVPERILGDLGILTAPLDADPFDPAEEPRELRRAAAPIEPGHADAALEQARELAPAVLYVRAGDGWGGSDEALEPAAGGVTSRIRTFESEAALMGCGWQAIAAAVVARTGGSLWDAEQAAAAVRGRTHVLAMLEHPPFAGITGGVPGVLFGSRALIRLDGPEIELLTRVGRRDAALVALRERFAREAQEGSGRLRVAVHHAGAQAAAEAMALWVERTLHPEEVVVAPLTRHAASRLGPGMVGVAWYREG